MEETYTFCSRYVIRPEEGGYTFGSRSLLDTGKPLPFFAEEGKGFVVVWMGGGLKAVAFAAGLLVAVGCLDGMDAVGDIQADAREVLRFDLMEEFSVETALVVCEIYRKGGEWKFNAVGAGYQGGLEALCRAYGVNV